MPSDQNGNPDDLDPVAFRAAAEQHLIEFTRELTEELCVRLRATAQADPKSAWLRRMLLQSRKAIK